MKLSKKLLHELENCTQPSIYWDRDMEFSPENLQSIFTSEDGLFTVMDELYDWNLDHIVSLIDEAIRDFVAEHWKLLPYSLRKGHKSFDTLWFEHQDEIEDLLRDYFQVDMEEDTLFGLSSPHPVIRTGVEIDLYYDFERNTYSDLKDLLDLLQINPYQFAVELGFNPGVFPNYFQRTKPVISIERLGEILKDTVSGELIILVDKNMDLKDYVTNFSKYNDKIWVHSNAVIVLADYHRGATSVEIITERGFLLDKKRHQFTWCEDKAERYGYYACCNPTSSIYKSFIEIFNKKEHGKSDRTNQKRIHLQRRSITGYQSGNGSSRSIRLLCKHQS